MKVKKKKHFAKIECFELLLGQQASNACLFISSVVLEGRP